MDTKRPHDRNARQAALAARREAEAAYDRELRAMNNPSAWDGLALSEQDGEQLAGNLGYVTQQLLDYQANHGGDHTGAEDSFQEARLRARLRDIKDEIARR